MNGNETKLISSLHDEWIKKGVQEASEEHDQRQSSVKNVSFKPPSRRMMEIIVVCTSATQFFPVLRLGRLG